MDTASDVALCVEEIEESVSDAVSLDNVRGTLVASEEGSVIRFDSHVSS